MKRLGFVEIIFEDREKSLGIVNEILSQFSEIIVACSGLPKAKENTSIITLVINATTDELSMLSGK